MIFYCGLVKGEYQTNLSGASPVGTKDERRRVSNDRVWIEALGPITTSSGIICPVTGRV
jgi:hypothetical protein